MSCEQVMHEATDMLLPIANRLSLKPKLDLEDVKAYSEKIREAEKHVESNCKGIESAGAREAVEIWDSALSNWKGDRSLVLLSFLTYIKANKDTGNTTPQTSSIAVRCIEILIDNPIFSTLGGLKPSEVESGYKEMIGRAEYQQVNGHESVQEVFKVFGYAMAYNIVKFRPAMFKNKYRVEDQSILRGHFINGLRVLAGLDINSGIN